MGAVEGERPSQGRESAAAAGLNVRKTKPQQRCRPEQPIVSRLSHWNFGMQKKKASRAM